MSLTNLNILISLATFLFCLSSFVMHREINLFAACALSILSTLIACKMSVKAESKSEVTVTAFSNGSVKLNGKYVKHISENTTGTHGNSYYFDLSEDKNTSKTFSDSGNKE